LYYQLFCNINTVILDEIILCATTNLGKKTWAKCYNNRNIDNDVRKINVAAVVYKISKPTPLRETDTQSIKS